MEQDPITMELGEKIDITAITTLKATLDTLPIKDQPLVLDARHVTHVDSASCQLFYAYAQYLAIHNTTLTFLSPSEKFMTVVKALGFETDFNYRTI